MRVWAVLALLVLGLGLTACAMPETDTAEPPIAPTVTPAPVVADTSEATAVEEAPAADEQPAPVAEVAMPEKIDWTRHAIVVDDYHVLGNPDAPVLIVDVSDFL